jgi:hypothetical protein
MSIWDDKDGRKHVGIMVDGKRIQKAAGRCNCE